MAAPVAYRANGQRSTPWITEPGIYDLTDDQYHGDPVVGGSLSSTGARKMLAPSCPALFKHERDNPSGPKRVFDFGHAAHMKVLGKGPKIRVIEAENYKLKKTQQEQKDAYAAGETPLLRTEYQQVEAMAAAILAHPVARRLFDPERGRAEQSLFWRDPDTGVMLRAKPDHLPYESRRRMVIADYKSAVDVAPDHLEKAFYRFQYHQQQPFYTDAVKALGLDDDPAFVFVVQMKSAPYLITIVELAAEAVQIGRERNRRAIELYAKCVADDHWPGFADDIYPLSLPHWAIRQHEMETEHTP